MKKTKLTTLTECAVMVALAFALSYVKVYEMPLGGSVTLASMLPIMLIGLKHGRLVGLGAGFAYSLTQLFQALLSGNVFPYCETALTLVLCILLDYLVPFTLLGLSGILVGVKLPWSREISFYLGSVLVVFIRFLCHFTTGVAIWGQWAPDGMGKYLYSLLYNGGYMLPELGITLALAALLLESPEIRRLIALPVDRA